MFDRVIGYCVGLWNSDTVPGSSQNDFSKEIAFDKYLFYNCFLIKYYINNIIIYLGMK